MQRPTRIFILTLLSLYSLLGFGQNMSYDVKIELDLCSKEMDFAPRFFGDSESKLIYTSAMDSKGEQITNLYFTEKQGRKWSKPKAVISEKGRYNAGVPSMDVNRNVIFFTKCYPNKNEKEAGCRIYFAYLSGELVGESFELEIPIPDSVKPITVGHPYFSNELQILLFAANIPGGIGGIDIWYSKYDKTNDSWGKPINVGAEINCAESDFYPVLASDRSLYFSSLGHDGFGGLDLFKSTYLGDLKWGKPVNMGAPINTESDDFGIEFQKDSNSGYFTSNRQGGVGSDDIYAFYPSGKPLVTEEVSIENTDNSEYNALFSTFNTDECNANSGRLKISEYSVYPNPNDGNFSFDFEANKPVELGIRVYSNSGEMLHTGVQKVSKGKTSMQFHFTGATAGVYHIQLLYDCEILASHKIIIIG